MFKFRSINYFAYMCNMQIKKKQKLIKKKRMLCCKTI